MGHHMEMVPHNLKLKGTNITGIVSGLLWNGLQFILSFISQTKPLQIIAVEAVENILKRIFPTLTLSTNVS